MAAKSESTLVIIAPERLWADSNAFVTPVKVCQNTENQNVKYVTQEKVHCEI